MKPNRWILLAALLPMFLLEGCIGPGTQSRKINYYTLEYEAPAFKGLTKLPFSLSMDRLQISPEYDTDKFVFRKYQFQRNQYSYEKWRANPRDLATYFLNRDLQRSGLFQGVFPPESLYKTSHLVTGSVDLFYEREGDPRQVILGLTLTFLKQDEPDVTQRILLQKTYEKIFPCQDETPTAMAGAMSQAMAGLSREVTLDLYRVLKESQNQER